MSKIRINSIKIKNYRSFGDEQEFIFTKENKPVAIVGYNNAGKTNLMNAIRYGIGDEFVSEKTFDKKDLHNLDYNNLIKIETDIEASKYSILTSYGNSEEKSIAGKHTLSTIYEDNELKASIKPSFFGANKHYSVFYINFHEIKKEISTQKTSWGNLTSFLAKHIKKTVENDNKMIDKKERFKTKIKCSTKEVLLNSDLCKFVDDIKRNYSINLRDNNCEIEFGLPDYEDIFLQMMFKIGLNGDKENLIPIEHFGDGYISMFIMAVINAIAESNIEDKCLFLFEEPESFLHENHQEYFYKVVLCGLAEKGHQVIYTTHSDKMVDLFDTEGLIRIEFDENKKQTIKKYNNIQKFNFNVIIDSNNKTSLVTMKDYNSFIKIIEPNLNRILFSRKVVLVEGPNDLLVYQHILKQKIIKLGKNENYAKSYLNFNNFAIIPHHGKITAVILIELCKHIGLEYFVINDFDLQEDSKFIEELSEFEKEEDLKKSKLYLNNFIEERDATSKGKITTNWKLIKSAGINQIHFNLPRLEGKIGYDSNDKNSLKIWEHINKIVEFDDGIFPEKLYKFLEINTI